MAAVMVYPRRFTSRLQSGQSQKSHGDQEVVMLYEDLLNHRVSVKSWGYRKRVIDAALRLFGDFRRWTSDQQENPDVAGYNVLFIDDCLSFIRTGQRQMSPMTWIGLLNEGDSKEKAVIRFDLKDVPAKSVSTIDILQKWCSHEDGISDLALSLYVLFGSKYKNL